MEIFLRFLTVDLQADEIEDNQVKNDLFILMLSRFILPLLIITRALRGESIDRVRFVKALKTNPEKNNCNHKRLGSWCKVSINRKTTSDVTIDTIPH